MRGSVVFFAVFAILLVVTLNFPTVPPGFLIVDVIGGVTTDFLVLGVPSAILVAAIFNGLVYSIIVGIAYTTMRNAKKRQITQQMRSVQVEDIGEEQVSRSISRLKIGPTYAKKLNQAGIKTIGALLESGSTRKGRLALAEKIGISDNLILDWINMSDLFRVKGIGREYSDLLEEVGVNTVVELSKRNPENLHTRILEINEQKVLVKKPPSLNEVTNWIGQAQNLPRKVKY